MSRLKDLPKEDYPREKALKYGLDFLTTSELIAIILGSGAKGVNVLELSQNLTSKYTSLYNLSNASVFDLSKNFGMNKIKSLKLLASLKLAMKLQFELIPTLTLTKYNPENVYNYFIHLYKTINVESIYIISIKNDGQILSQKLYCHGFKKTLTFDNDLILNIINNPQCKKIIILHNHKTDDVEPSFSDIESTINLEKELKKYKIILLDHLIISNFKYYSFRNNHLLINN